MDVDDDLSGGRALYYDWEGRPISQAQWVPLLGQERHVAEAYVAGRYYVSTVWLGLDHSFGTGPPLIFETMVFGLGSGFAELDCRRYSTLEQARAGHAETVAVLRLTSELEP